MNSVVVKNSVNTNKVLLSLIIILGVALRLTNLNQSLWLDEAISALAVKSYTLSQLITVFSIGDFHPPLYYVLLKIWSSVFGFSEFSLRLPSVIFGSITIFFVYKIARLRGSRQIAHLSAFFMAINPLAVYYSQEARMYSLAALLVTVSVFSFLKRDWKMFSLAFGAAMLTDYLPILMVPAFLVISKDLRVAWKWIGVSIMIFLPWVPILWLQLEKGLSVSSTLPSWAKVLGESSLKGVALTMVKFTIGRISLDNKLMYTLVVAPMIAVFGLLLVKSRRKELLIWFIVPLALGFLISMVVPIYSYFRFLFVLPAFVLLVANGAIKSKFSIAVVTVIFLGSLIIFNLNSKFWREDWKKFAGSINPDSLVVMPSSAQSAPLIYYGHNRVQDLTGLNLEGSKEVYLLRYVQEIFDPGDNEKKALEDSGFRKVQEMNFNGVIVWKYQLQL